MRSLSIKIINTIAALCLGFVFLTGQSSDKKTLGIEEFNIWKRIENAQISDKGALVCYELEVGEGAADGTLVLYQTANQMEKRFPRGYKAAISLDEAFLVFMIKPHVDSLKAMRRRGVKRKHLPTDTLAIYHVEKDSLEKIPNVKNFKLPEKWSGSLGFQQKGNNDKDKQTALILYNLQSGLTDTIPEVETYQFAETSAQWLAHSVGKDAVFEAGIYLFNGAEGDLQPVFQGKGDYQQLAIHKDGKQLAFLADLDTLDKQVQDYQLYHWTGGNEMASVKSIPEKFMPEGWRLSENGNLYFSESGERLFFGIAPYPILQDTSLLEEEIVNVEVWSYTDQELYTRQENRLNREKRRTYTCVLDLDQGSFVQLADREMPGVEFSKKGDGRFALGTSALPYQMESSWISGSYRDIYLVDVPSGEKTRIGEKVLAYPNLSPDGTFVYWYNSADTAWFAYSNSSRQLAQVTNNKVVPFYNELEDSPRLPGSYGMAGWIEGDEAMLIYDRYDIWRVDPKGKTTPVNLTNGRSNQMTYRYIDLDREEAFVPKGRILLHQFSHLTKREGYIWLSLIDGKLEQVQEAPLHYTTFVRKAKHADRYLFTVEDFQRFPDLLYAEDPDLKSFKQISDANPQQSAYNWGTMELYEWTSLTGEKLQGLLVKPENFDPDKKYPMIVNFYERNSDRIHRHRPHVPNRSQITYAHYASRGYVIFNPDIPYRIGYPGESAFNAVVSGTTALINEGFIDEKRIGVQGHSWGGYQIAYLLTQTDIFACAEAGAPVVNMFSAYGGIRWGSGISRVFQYEQTQSRIGGTIWEYPLRYLENSPLFFLDKVNTPVLIMHNDQDGAVPWYQGIEYFVGLRRLGKPSWLLNYNDQPHWPLKRQNRMDFQLRMEQFFDHYLMDGPKPLWMERGVPAIEKGINQGYEAADKN